MHIQLDLILLIFCLFVCLFKNQIFTGQADGLGPRSLEVSRLVSIYFGFQTIEVDGFSIILDLTIHGSGY